MNPEKDHSHKANRYKVAGLQVLKNPCVWMRAGVINFRTCENNYDCVNCDFDRSMRSAMTAQAPTKGVAAPTSWAKEMRLKHTGDFKPCRYYLTKQLGPPGRCQRDYQCDDCPVDLMMEYAPLTEAINKTEDSPRITDPEFAGRECVWMRAGVVNFHLCETDFDCYHCSFDRNMRSAMAVESRPQPGTVSTKPLSWEERMNKDFEALDHECIYFMAGQPDAPEACRYDFACFSCPVHQELGDPYRPLPLSANKPTIKLSSGFRVADGYYYHYGHTWVHVIHGGCVRIGIDDFMAKVFGRARGIDLPPAGTSLKQGRVGWLMARNGHRAAVQSPLSGTVTAVNREALDNPGQVHETPYDKGWLFHLEPSSLNQEAQMLYFGEASRQWMEKEHDGLLQMMGPEYERLAATGAEAVGDLYGAFPELGWKRLAGRFLHTRENE